MGASPKDASALSAKVGRLRAEHDAFESPSTRAILLHEIGVLEERLGDEAAAARDLLGAVNTDPEFREPLERLVAIIERRQSYKNLGKLLERLSRVADTSAERSRALLDHAAFLADHEENVDLAKSALRGAAEETPEDPAVWLSLELLAARTGDTELGERALATRAELAQDPTWRALLLLDLADLRAERDDIDRAFETIDQAIAQGGEATFLALLTSGRLGRRFDRPDMEAKSLETQGELILRALTEPLDGDALGVPKKSRSRASVADAWLRASELHRERGDASQATNLLDRALIEVPGNVLLIHARLALAENAGDTATAARLAQVELDLGVDGELGAALWLRVAEAAAAEGDGGAALSAVEKAIGLAPGCVPALALQLDLLAAQGDAPRLATALEATADQLESDSAKANFYLTSADVWARLAADVAGAKAALSQASMYGTPPAVVARVARLLASSLGDSAWYEDATRRLLAQGAADDEHAPLWFELGRARSLRGDRAGARAAFASIATAQGGGFLGNTLGAYASALVAKSPSGSGLSVPPDDKPWTQLSALAEAEKEPELARALRVSVALRALLAGEPEQAIEQLGILHSSDPSDLVAAGALSLLYRTGGSIVEARDVLAKAAETTSDAELRVAMQLAAGILSWQASERREAVETFRRAAEERPEASSTALAWALRAAEPNEPSARARALDVLAESDPALAALERFALEVGRGGSSETAEQALRGIDAASAPEIGRAAELAHALWSHGSEGSETRKSALDSLCRHGTEVARLARAAAHQLEVEGQDHSQAPDAERALETAERWARADPDVAPALEWLSFAIASRDPAQEIAARRALAERLPEPTQSLLRASAAITGALTDTEAPDSSGDHPALQLARLELTLPGAEPSARAAALTQARAALGDDSAPIVTALAGFNLLAAGDLEGAEAAFRSVVESFPEEVIGWEGLRATARAAGDRHTLAEASASLGDAVSDPARGAELWEEAAGILLDQLSDPLRGEFALSRAVERDVQRFSAFDRLFRMVRARKDGQRLLELITRRLAVTDNPEEIVKLYWERARALRESGDREGAIRALALVREREPEHVGALALTGEISITLGRFAEAAENLERLARHAQAPGQQRLLSGMAAVDLYENRLEDSGRALEVLSVLFRAGLSTQPVRERLARTAAKVGAWEQATEVLEQLMNERASTSGRIEAARLAMAIYRDELSMAEAAQDAVTRLLQEAPSDGEALDLVLTGAFAESLTRSLLERGLKSLVAELHENPMDTVQVDRLARIAEKLDRTALRQAALGTLVALGADARRIDPELLRLDQRVARLPKIAIDEQALPYLADPDDEGPIGELMLAIASTIAEALGPGLAARGVTKRERVDPRAGLALRNEIAAWAGALGIGEFELYVGGRDPTGVCAIATETPAIVVGNQVDAPLSPFYRQAIARELLSLRRGTSVLRHREAEEVHALIVAACRIGEVELPSPPFALLGEFQRQLAREMPRRVRKALPPLARAVRNSEQDPVAWYQAATSTLDRMASIAAGDVSWVLASEPSQRGRLAPTREGELRARRLLSFVLSPGYLEVRDKLGMGVR